jgi:tungstate transport system ATP-binding protein
MHNVQVHRGSRKNVLDILEFSVNKGELIAIVGSNGAGKTTLLQVINLLCPYEGKYTLFGKDSRVSDQTLLRRRLAMVFQEPLFLHDTVLSNVAFGLKLRGMNLAERKKKANAALADFRCEHLAMRSAYMLSGGEAQRVSIARAMALDPELLLLDEPFSAQDVAVRQELLESIRQMALCKGITVLLVSHNFSDVLRFANRVIFISQGKIVQDAAPEFILRRPSSIEVAKVLGMDNIIPCRITSKDTIELINGIVFPCPQGLYSVTACCLPGDTLYLWHDSLDANASWIKFQGIIERILPGIGNYQMFVKAGNQMFNLRIARDAALTYQNSQGTKVTIAFDSKEAHFV